MTDNEFILTLDVDWAPDSVIRHVAAVLREKGVKATWFISHDSPAVRELLCWPDFEAGLHPNYLPGSSQGSSTHEVLETLLRIVPDAVSVRSHAIVQSGPLLNHYVEHTSLKIDSTIFLPEMPRSLRSQNLRMMHSERGLISRFQAFPARLVKPGARVKRTVSFCQQRLLLSRRDCSPANLGGNVARCSVPRDAVVGEGQCSSVDTGTVEGDSVIRQLDRRSGVGQDPNLVATDGAVVDNYLSAVVCLRPGRVSREDRSVDHDMVSRGDGDAEVVKMDLRVIDYGVKARPDNEDPGS